MGNVVTPCTRKAPGFRKGNPRRDLKRRAAEAGRVRHDRDEGPIGIAEGHADHQRGPRLARLAEVDQPDLTAPRRRHLPRRERCKESVRSGADLIVGERTGVEGQRAAEHLLGEGALFFRRQMLEGLEQGLGLAAHRPLNLAEPACMEAGLCVFYSPITGIIGRHFASAHAEIFPAWAIRVPRTPARFHVRNFFRCQITAIVERGLSKWSGP